jgi:hypothetical protein
MWTANICIQQEQHFARLGLTLAYIEGKNGRSIEIYAAGA